MKKLTLVPCPTEDAAKTNRAILNYNEPLAQDSNIKHVAVRTPGGQDAFVFTIGTHSDVAPDSISINNQGRKWASLPLKGDLEVAAYKFDLKSQCLTSITFEVDFMKRNNPQANREHDTVEMAREFSRCMVGQAFTVGQLVAFVFEANKVKFELKVKDLEAINASEDLTTPVEIGLTTPNTIILFEPAEGSNVRLTGKATANQQQAQIFSQKLDYAGMGIGGLSDQFKVLLRRAFLTRLLPPAVVQQSKIKFVRGVLLYGPPGTGKTLIARQIGQLLLARPPKIVNGPEVLNKYVGESEANIRALFKEAEEEQAKSGIYSGLHLIIFDEIDAICKARGASASSSGVGDQVVNQLLSKIDGVEALNNVLLIGMTNRKDLLDEALLRPGRFEVQIEIGLPNEQGRLEILQIHTKEIRDLGWLDKSVSLDYLAAKAKNFTGAELVGLITAANQRAIERAINIDKKIEEKDCENILITREDFDTAMEQDIKPALGAAIEIGRHADPIIEWDPFITQLVQEHGRFDNILERLDRRSVNLPYFVAFTGRPRTGLSTLAANLATRTKFPFIRFYWDMAFSNHSESGQVEAIRKLFEDAAKSELSCVIIDDLHLLFEYHPNGPRYLSTLRKVFALLRHRKLPLGHKLLVICTCCQERALSDLSIAELFDDTVRVPSLTTPKQVIRALNSMEFPLAGRQKDLEDALANIPFAMGISQLEELKEQALLAPQDEQIRKLLTLFHSGGYVIKDSRLDEPFRF